MRELVPVGVEDLDPQALLVRVAKALVVLDTDADADNVTVLIAVSVTFPVPDTVALTLTVCDPREEAVIDGELVEEEEIRADPDDVTVRLEAVAVIEGVSLGELVGPGEAVKEAVGLIVTEPLPLAVGHGKAEPEAEGLAEDM